MEVKDLQHNLQMSPMLPVSPAVISYGKRVEIKMEDSFLQANTTYRLNLGDALVDNREANPYKNFVYIFSTGNYFDSLKLHGRVLDAATGLPDSTATVLLYPESEMDSAILRKKPAYAQKVDAGGHFSFELLPGQAFHAYAIEDGDNNYVYTPVTEKVDFMDSPVRPLFEKDSLLTFAVFKEQVDSAVENDGETSDRLNTKGHNRPRTYPKNDLGYQVLVDTINREKGSLDLTEPLIVELHRALSELDSSRIYLSYDDDGIEVEAIAQIARDSVGIKLKTEWQADKIYTLRLVKDWAKDTAGTALLPGKYLFRTKRIEDYGTLKVLVDSAFIGRQFVLSIRREADSVYQQPVISGNINLSLLRPGNYTLRIIVDENENGKWDTGNFFKKKHAERVIPYPGNVVLKSGWENEVDFKKPEENPEAAKTKSDRFSGNPETKGRVNKK